MKSILSRPGLLAVAAAGAVAAAAGNAGAQTIYIGPAAGDWDAGANWSTGAAPAAGAAAVVDNRAQNSTVSIGTSRSRAVLTFDIQTGDAVVVGNNSVLSITGTSLQLAGQLRIQGEGNATDLRIDAADTALTGSGSIVLGGASNNSRLFGSGSLLNSATIEGRGQLGVNLLTVTNLAGGLIDANVSLAENPGALLLLDPRNAGGLVNQGTMQASAGGILQLTGNGGGAFDNSGGLIRAVGAGSEVRFLNSSSVVGGTLRSDDGGVLRGIGSENYFFTDVAFDAGTQVVAENNSDFGVLGTIANDGRITINAAGNATDIELQGDTAFAGTGEIILAGTNNARIHGISENNLLTNGDGHTIRGRGQIGVNSAGVVNNGTITADVPDDGAVLLLDPSNALGFDNNATLQAVGGGILQLTGNGGGIFDNGDGLIRAAGEGSEVQFTTSSSVVGGTLRTEDGGLLRGLANQNYFFTDVTFDAGAQVVGENNSDFGVLGTITNNGVITINAGGNATDIEVQGDTAFAGTGEVVLTGPNNARIHGLTGTRTLTNVSGHTIRGQGQIGVNLIGVVNNGTISADVPDDGAALLLDPSNALGFDNNATLQAVGGGILQLTGNGGGVFDNSGGLIQAAGAGSEVQFTTNSSVVGGTLRTEEGGTLRGMVSTNYFFTDVTFDAGAQVVGENNSDFGVLGTITNNGVITIIAGGNATDIELQGDTAFLGSGEIVLSTTNPATSNARIHGVTGARTLTNGSGHIIRGQGQIGVNNMNVFNAAGAIIDASVDGAALVLDPINGTRTFDNRGLLSASNGGILQLSGSGGGSFDNTGGVIRANDGSEVQILSSASIDGGSLETEGSGLIHLPANQSAALSNLALSGGLIMSNNSSLTLSGNISHNGNLTIDAGGNATDLLIDSILDLQGGGVISMTSNNARIRGPGVLINRDHLIQGAGQIGINQSAATNAVAGTIHANLASGDILLDPNELLGFVNDGILRASAGGTINLSGAGGGQFSFGDTSVVEALDGGAITHSGNAILTNLRNGTLTGGAYRIIDTGNGASLTLPGGNITTNAADIELSGAGAQFAQLGSLSRNEGSLSVANGTRLQASGDFTHTATGSLEVDIAGKPAQTGLWGSIVAAGKAVLGGVLHVSVNIGNTFAAALGDVWKIVAGSTREGEFADVQITTGNLPAGSRIAVDYVNDGVEVAVVPDIAGRVSAPTYVSWAAALHHTLDPDPMADSDGDGATNVEEYAFGMDPSAADAWRMPSPGLARVDGWTFAEISYSRPSGASVPSDVIYTVERSHDLETWTSSGLTFADPEPMDQGGFELVTARCEDAMGGEAAPTFLRVSVRLVR